MHGGKSTENWPQNPCVTHAAPLADPLRNPLCVDVSYVCTALFTCGRITPTDRQAILMYHIQAVEKNHMDLGVGWGSLDPCR